MAREYFAAYHSYLKSIDPLNDTERGRLFTALLEYSSTGIEPELRGNERYVFPMMREQIDRDREKYESFCQKQKANIEKRWDTNVYRGISGIPSDTKNTKEKEKEKKKEKEKESNISAYAPDLSPFSPAMQEAIQKWLEYKHERKEPYKPTGLNSLLKQLEKLVDAYSEDTVISLIEECMANGWKGIIKERLEKYPAAKKTDSGRGTTYDLTEFERMLSDE